MRPLLVFCGQAAGVVGRVPKSASTEFTLFSRLRSASRASNGENLIGRAMPFHAGNNGLNPSAKMVNFEQNRQLGRFRFLWIAKALLLLFEQTVNF